MFSALEQIVPGVATHENAANSLYRKCGFERLGTERGR